MQLGRARARWYRRLTLLGLLDCLQNCNTQLFCLQLAASAGKKIVGALSALDVKLEEVGVLPKLTPQPVPEDVADEDGQMHNDRMEARSSRP